MKDYGNLVYLNEPCRKCSIDINKDTKLQVEFAGLDGGLDFMGPHSENERLKPISSYKQLEKFEKEIRKDFYQHHVLPEGVSDCSYEKGEAMVIFLLDGLYERDGEYIAVYDYASFVS